MPMRFCLIRSLRNLFYTVLLIVTGSALITYNCCRYLSFREDKKLNTGKRASTLLRHESSLLQYIVEEKGGSEEALAKKALEGIYDDIKIAANEAVSSSAGRNLVEDVEVSKKETSESNMADCNGDHCTHRVSDRADINNIPATESTPVYQKNNKNDQPCCDTSCTEDSSSLPYLACLLFEPAVQTLPPFNSTHFADYYATVSHKVVLLQVYAKASHCSVDVRLTSRHRQNRFANFTLGLGLNVIHILLFYNRGVKPWVNDPCNDSTGSTVECVINTYTLHVYRKQAGELAHGKESYPDIPSAAGRAEGLRACQLRQECGLQFLPSERCGMQPSDHESWSSYKSHVGRLKSCTSGHENGSWLLPCVSCDDDSSCVWKEAVWQPHNCVHTRLSRNVLQECLANKKILFIGDSTNRGIMHYLMENVNGSLTEWDKTHDIKVYQNINQHRTTVSFAYYPQFWLSTVERPMFDEALFQILKMTHPVENNHRTVLVVGGVHWLAVHHLNVIVALLKSEGLTDIQVIIKTLGAGFHQPVDGLHHLTLAEQRRLVNHNAALVDHAVTLGFQVVETFNMTMARYADFLQGKCACHFHRIKEVLPSFSQYVRSSLLSGQDKLADMPIHYHVEGDINAVYSEIVFNRICEGG